MMKVRVPLAVAAVLVATALCCAARPLATASTDRLPREDWSYDAMIHLAGRGIVPGMTAQRFMGDWLYDREEMAAFVRDAIAASGEATAAEDKALLGKLASEFRSELIAIGAADAVAKAEPYAAIQARTVTGFVEGRIGRADGDSDISSVYRVTGIDSIRKYVTAAVTLSDERRRADGKAFSRLEKWFVRGKTPNWEWELGKDFMWWGPGYSGSMILSDNSPGFVMGKIGKDFSFGKRIGYIKITQFASSFEDGGARYYLYGRRWEKTFSRRFHLGVNETAKTTNIKPNPLIALLPSFYLYQRIFRDEVETELNDLVSIDFTYKLSPRFHTYADWLVDDMQAPQGFYQGHPWHQKRRTGWLVGGYLPDVLGDGTTGLRAEYIVVDPETFLASRPEVPGLAYTHDDFVIGHPVGPNSKAIFLRGDRTFGNNWAGVVEYLGRTPRASDGPNPFNTSRLSLLAVRDLTPRGSLTVRYERLKLPATESKFWVAGNYAF